MKNNSQLNMHYGACPKKIESRSQTIIHAYQEHYKRKAIPKDQQYWTICGRCSYKDGILEENCEPDQIIKSGLATASQIHGIEINKAIHESNAKSGLDINWHRGDFYNIMVEYANNNHFNPAIVNADLLHMPDYATVYLSKLMQFLSAFDGRTMLVGNMVKEICNSRRSDIEDVIAGFEKEPCFHHAMCKAKWKLHDQYYWYNGTGKTTTKMITIVWFKDEA